VGIDMPCVDLNVNTERFPRPGQGEAIRRLSWQGGGKVATGLVACARLGAKCAVMGCVGDDIFGRFIVKDFLLHGIDTSALRIRTAYSSSLSIVLSDYETGNRAIVCRQGSAPHFSPEDIDLDMIRGAKYFFICQGGRDMEKAVDAARNAGVRIFIDADGYSDEVVSMLHKIDVFVGSESFYNRMFGNRNYRENCRAISEMGPRIAVFTFGAKGCAGMGGEGFFQLPAFPVNAEDTVGAGDVFHGAFVTGLLDGLSAEEAARFASAAAAIKCTRIGGRAGIPDRRTLERFLSEGVIDYTEIDARVEFYQRGLENV